MRSTPTASRYWMQMFDPETPVLDMMGDWITGEQGDDRIFGSAAHDALFGGGGADKIHGGAGNDVLDGDDNYYNCRLLVG